jgi:hypothetical protein
MAASTTALGLIPLLFDAFFVSMAVTIIFGLGFATLLTMVVVPVPHAVGNDRNKLTVTNGTYLSQNSGRCKTKH